MKLFIDKSKCRIEEALNGQSITIETKKSIIIQDGDKDYLLVQQWTDNGNSYKLPSPVVIGTLEGLGL